MLRWWRQDVLGLSQIQTAERLSVQPTALSNWENGARAISLDIAQLDDVLDGDGVLAGLLWGFGTPRGLDADHLWTKVFPGEAGPVWVWFRSLSPEVKLAGEWGVARVDADFELGPNGLFMTVGLSIPVSPIVLHFSEPTWADFGRGQLPDKIPGAPIVSAITLAERSTNTGGFMDMFFGNMADRFGRSGRREVSALSDHAPKSLARFLASFDRSGSGRKPSWPPLPSGEDDIERLRFARLRRARGLSLVETAERLVELADVTVSKDTLRRFETDVGQPHERLLPVALDHVLGAEGRLAIVEIRSDTGSGAVRFPSYWSGPIWIAFDGPEASEVAIRLEFADWSRDFRITLPILVIHHFSAEGVPLRITAPPNVRWTVGVGRRAGAIAIDHGWSPATMEVAQEAVSATENALLESLIVGADESEAALVEDMVDDDLDDPDHP